MPGRTTAAKRFAEAVAGLARQDNSWEQWRRELSVVREALDNPQLRSLLESPRTAAGQRSQVMEQVFGGRVSAMTLNLLKVMGRRGRISLLPDMLVWFDEIADRALGVRRYDVTTATPLTNDQRQRLRDRLGARGGQVILNEQVDPSLLGGLVLQQEDIIRDYSVRARLESLRGRLN